MKSLFRTLSICSIPLLAVADGDPLEGHSGHGEAFNEGPRQAAYIMQGMADINFPVTTGDPLAQIYFNQGVGQLHGFWYFEAERSFRQVLQIDTNCVMAYWGMAMANAENPERAAKLIAETKDRQEHLTGREKLWIKSLTNYYRDLKADDKRRRRTLVRDIETIIHENPDDLEAKAFLAVQIWKNARKGHPIASHEAVNALVEQVLSARPNHPAHHYRIHLWDSEKSRMALSSAAACGHAGPGIAHLWHMPGHIYAKLNRYADAAWQQEASARVDHAHMIRDRVLPDRIHNYAHNNGWLSENLGFAGRARDAVDLAANMVELPRRPKFREDMDGEDEWSRGGSSLAGGQNRLFNDLPAFELWDTVLDLDGKGYLSGLGDLPTETRRLHLLGLAALHLERTDEAGSALETLRAHRKQLQHARYRAADHAEEKARREKKKQEEIDKAVTEALKNYRKHVEKADQAIRELEVASKVFAGKGEDVAKSLGELKGVPKLRHAHYWLKTGDMEKALKLATDEGKGSKHKRIREAGVIDVLWQAGKPEDAKKRFRENLRPDSRLVDLELPVMQRLAPIAAELEWPADWRLEREDPGDLGDRPDLDSLGPFRWHPWSAPDFTLPDREQKKTQLADFRGKPVLLIFYLGAGCAHCMEQLEAFKPVTADYEAAGIPILAISTDTVEGLEKTFEKIGKAEDISFQIVSDHGLDQFKAFRAYDDFEQTPLHGTFLIDAEGRVRWQDISYEPFMHPDFLLEEAKRLLKLPVVRG